MISRRLAAQVKSFGVPLAFSYHIATATATRQRGTMLKWGRTPCHRWFQTCTSCVAQGLGLPKPFARLLGGTPPALGDLLHSKEGSA